MKSQCFKPTHTVVQTTGEFKFLFGELLQRLSENYYKDVAGNIAFVDGECLEEYVR